VRGCGELVVVEGRLPPRKGERGVSFKSADQFAQVKKGASGGGGTDFINEREKLQTKRALLYTTTETPCLKGIPD